MKQEGETVDERLKQLFKEERDKLGRFHSPDADFIAYERALKRLEEEKQSKP